MSSASMTSGPAGGRRPPAAATWAAPDRSRPAAPARGGDCRGSLPDAALVWAWTESVVLSGYGPPASAFL